ncbi:endo alpha-1,4 polygalactosaminidase [Azotosporobacter soli]|uniref:endo alpha-1,4 polygalactosaminidase n=1 Tax=Azotosporobacter soli TaxID=3055040 RepID=UPI0031FE7D57
MFFRSACCTLLFLLCIAALPSLARAQQTPPDYPLEMARLLGQLRSYSQERNATFQLLGNGSLDLFAPETLTPSARTLVNTSLDGILMESYFYGWEMKDDEATPPEARLAWSSALTAAQQLNQPLFNIDYCRSTAAVADSYQKNRQAGFVSLAAPNRQLTKLPQKTQRSNRSDVSRLAQAKNFLVLLNPEEFASRSLYLAALRACAFDLLIIDPTFNSSPLTPDEVRSLKRKPQGGQRLVLAYLSIAEAEDYRPYWQKDWKQSPPAWLVAANPDWVGNFKVRYWQSGWQQLLFGSRNAQLDRILSTDFDGAMLDVVDGYQYFLDNPDVQ